MRYWICVCKEYDKDWQEEYGAIWEWWKHGANGDRSGKHTACFEQMREGDKVLCYETTTHSFTAVLEVSEKFENNSKMKLTFKQKTKVPLDSITKDEHYQKILASNADKYSPFTANKSNLFYGTFFATTKEQFEYICSLAQCNE
ncbi:EVE domain-containing protein [Helicobacter sp.]|uniref:EVE domain-containing protein n=1 Tax=Helicobacter sp. TaxID=218 RepID=UPI001999AE05|nr:EVE domain-containing protein [Helicobacter sp.]MBD5164791.1 EVE domain-containing protein [Helicobacter sp.]